MTAPLRSSAFSAALPTSHGSDSIAPRPIPGTPANRSERSISEIQHREILRQAFADRDPARSVAARFGSPWSHTPWALLGGLTGCSNHPPLVDHEPSDSGGGGLDAGRPDSGQGDEGGAPDAGQGGQGGDGGLDGGNAPVCQTRLPVAVMFYDCVEMAPAGEPTTRVCFSEKHFGGDIVAARSYVSRGLDLTRELYTRSCSSLQIDPVLFFPERALNGRVGHPEFDFVGFDYSADGIDNPAYLHHQHPGRIASDLEALGADPTGFGVYVSLNGWDSSILPTHAPATHNLNHRSSPPYALIGVNLEQSLEPYLQYPIVISHTLRHEMDHALNDIESHFGFDRLPSTHSTHPFCPIEGDWTWLCRTEYDQAGTPLRAADWQMLLGATGIPVTCDDSTWQANCAQPETETCGETVCPSLPHFDNSCNEQGLCEYVPSSPTDSWQAYNAWIYVPPGGSFDMGSAEGSLGHQANESPVTPVTFTRGYFIGKYEVPVEALEACLAAGACHPNPNETWNGNGWGRNSSSDRPLHPANYLGINQAGMVCGFLFPGGRLPSRAEWEFAARGPENLLFPFGNTPATCSGDQANFNESGTAAGYGCGSGGTRPIHSGINGASWLGALNMAGNVWEWLGDCWLPDHSSAPTNGHTYNSSGCYTFNLAGGAFNDGINLLRGSQRYPLWYSNGNANVGARCAISASWVYDH